MILILLLFLDLFDVPSEPAESIVVEAVGEANLSVYGDV